MTRKVGYARVSTEGQNLGRQLSALHQAGCDPILQDKASGKSVRGRPGLDKAIKAILAGQKIHFNGATGPINFGENGRISAASYDVWQHMPDGSAKVVKTIKFAP